MSSTAASVRRLKLKRPHLYCPAPGCLWQIVSGTGKPLAPCRRHPVTPDPIAALAALSAASTANAVRAGIIGLIHDSLEPPPSLAERVARYHCVRVMSHVIESMTSLREIWEVTDLKAGPDENPLHIVGVRDDETICFRHTVGGCDADIAVDAERLRLTLEDPDEPDRDGALCTICGHPAWMHSADDHDHTPEE